MGWLESQLAPLTNATGVSWQAFILLFLLVVPIFLAVGINSLALYIRSKRFENQERIQKGEKEERPWFVDHSLEENRWDN